MDDTTCDNLIDIASARLLHPGDMDLAALPAVLGRLLGPSIDYGELYFQHSRHESWSLEDSAVRSGSYGVEQGAGLRAVSGEKTGLAYADRIAPATLREAAGKARAIAAHGPSHPGRPLVARPPPPLYPPDDPLVQIDDADKVALLHRIDAFARSLDPRIEQVQATLAATHETVLIAASDGTLAADIRPLVRLSVQVIAVAGGRRETGHSGGGGRYDYWRLLGDEVWQKWVKDAVRQALINLEADDAPAGTMTVVLGPGWPGVLLHEAVGHGLEADFIRKGTSAFSHRRGEKVASALCTVVDDGTLPERRGSLAIDDEGTPAAKTVLIEDGRLVNFMQDKLNARLLGMAPTGNGRRESFAHLPMPRMTNTYMLPGRHGRDEIIASVKHGLYAANFGGGQVDITSGKFVFSASEAWLIENGQLTRPVRGATLIGNGPEVLTRVSMVGDDLALDEGIGVCGKEGQSVPVGVGQPTLKIDRLTVGGTRA